MSPQSIVTTAALLIIPPFLHVHGKFYYSEIRACNEVLYDDTTEWENEPDSFCGDDNQSPIDIDTDDTIQESSKCNDFEWDLDTDHRTFSVTNNGYQLSIV